MEETKFNVTHSTNDYPVGLKTADEMAEILMGDISAERLVELADSGYLPHFRIDGGAPKFKQSEVKKWVANNLLGRCEGRSLQEAIRVVIPPDGILERPPESISNIQSLRQVPKYGFQPGVYFLCKGNDVVYVGQSSNPSARIDQHSKDSNKDYDRVYLLPTPLSELNDVEAAFIHHLKPVLNGVTKKGAGVFVSPVMSRPKEDIIQSVQI